MVQKVSIRDIKKIYTDRPSEVRKYDYGLMLVIGGSESYTGAPALAGLAGFRAGLDMVRVIAPQRAADVIASFSPILATYGFENSHLLKEHLALLISRTLAAKEVSRGNVSVVIGSGLGRTEETQDTIIEYLSQTDVPVVIDADAIHAVAKKPNVLSGKPFVLTPNTYEFTLLTGKQIRELSEKERIEVVQAEAARLETTILLKAGVDIISNGQEVILDTAGSPYLSIGGTGDTLAGIIGALLTRGLSPLDAAAAGAFINGKAGEIAARKFKDALVATDVIDAIPEVIK